MSNLQVLARRCPVMNKALAVQSARLSGTKRFTSRAAGVAAFQPMRTPADRRDLHSSNGNPASLASGGYQKTERGKFDLWRTVLRSMLI